MIVNCEKESCLNCKNKENDSVFGLICVHKASIEGIEAEKSFYTPNEVTECNLYQPE